MSFVELDAANPMNPFNKFSIFEPIPHLTDSTKGIVASLFLPRIESD
jgi:hypothetical protein